MIINNSAYSIACTALKYGQTINKNFYNGNIQKSSMESSTFKTSFKRNENGYKLSPLIHSGLIFRLKGVKKGNSVTTLASQIKLLTECDDKKQVNDYLNRFIDYETIILGTSEKDDVIKSMQLMADAASEENDPEILSKYIVALHKAIYPNTGIGKYINCKEILKNSNLSEADVKRLNDINNN